jgi:hypothetical protein
MPIQVIAKLKRNNMQRFILLISLITAKLTFGQTNGSFEVWDTVYAGVYSLHLDTAFSVPNPLGGKINRWKSDQNYGISRTTDSYSGNYSLILHNWYQYVQQTIFYKDSINSRPQFLQGYYKYQTAAAKPAHGIIKVALTRFNGTINDTIAKGTFVFDSTNYFKPFQLNINYISPLSPDSIYIFIENADKDCVDQTMVCNLLYIDALALTNSPLSVTNLNLSKISFYPNPTNENIAFKLPSNKNFSLKIYDALGKLSKSLVVSNNSTLSISDFARGVYFFTLQDTEGNIILTDKVIKQ